MKILIADDHIILRRGIRSILEEAPALSVDCQEASNGFEAIDATRKDNFDLVLLDISMPGKDGIDTLKQLRYERPDLPVLILTMHPEERFAVRAIKAGAAGYLNKDCSPDELLRAVDEIMIRGRYISPSLGKALAEAMDTTGDKPVMELLSDREVQVMRLIASAMTASEIAEELKISSKTVTTYRGRILEKLGLKNTAELIRHAIENGIVE